MSSKRTFEQQKEQLEQQKNILSSKRNNLNSKKSRKRREKKKKNDDKVKITNDQTEQIKKLQNELNEKDTEHIEIIDQLKKVIIQLEDEHEIYIKKSKKSNEIRFVKDEHHALVHEFNQLKEQYQQMSKEIEHFKSENIVLQSQIIKYKSQIHLTHDSTDHLKKYKERCDKFSIKITKLNNDISSIRLLNQKLTSEKLDFEHIIHELKEELNEKIYNVNN